jgi:hypothetical protein
MNQIKLFSLISLLIGLFACTQTNQRKAQTELPKNWKSINGKAYMIQYPDSFILDTSGQMGSKFIILSKLVSHQDKFRENINLIIQDLTGQNLDLNKYVEISEGQVKTMITNGNIIESKRISTGNPEFHKIIYTGNQGQYHLKFEQYYWIVK